MAPDACSRSDDFDAIVFDMDGLLLDTEPLYMRAWQDAAGELGYSLSDELHYELIGLSNKASHQRLSDVLGPGFPLASFSQRWPHLWVQIAETDGIALKPGVADMLALVEEFGLHRGIATSSTVENVDRSLRLAGLADTFPVRVTGDQVSHGKPSPDIYLEAASRLGVDPRRCLALEDSEPGLLAAVGAGMTTVVVPDLKRPSPGALTRAHQCVSSLHEAAQVIRALI